MTAQERQGEQPVLSYQKSGSFLEEGSPILDGTPTPVRLSLLQNFRQAFSFDKSGSFGDSFRSSKGEGRSGTWWRNKILVYCVALCFAALGILGFFFRPHWETTISSSASSTETCGGSDYSMLSRMKSSFMVEGLKKGAVAADHPLCSELGTKMMRDYGGNAVDAAVTVALCLGVANPASSGLGGGAFWLIHSDVSTTTANKKQVLFHDARNDGLDAKDDEKNFAVRSQSGKVIEVVDCREVAGSAADRDMFLDRPRNASLFGGLAAAVPGELRGLELAHSRFGRLPWSSVVDPVISLAKDGVVVNENLAHEIEVAAKLRLPGGLRTLLTNGDSWDRPLKEGDVMRNPRLADTLTAVRDGGADALYRGERARQLAREIQAAGGIITAEDIENYRATLRNPVVGRGINGVSVVGVPPPSSGGVAVIGALRFLSGFKSPLAMFAGGLSVHRVVEALKHAFAIRMSLSDPNFNTATVLDAVHDLVEGDYMETLRREKYLDNSTLPLSQYGGPKWTQLNDGDGSVKAKDGKEGDRRRRLGTSRRMANRFGYLNDHGTSHFVVMDSDGNVVSATSSVNMYFGSGILSPSTGVILSNTMDDFSNPGNPDAFGLHPSESNYIAPGKKPLSSMSPTMVFRELEDDSKNNNDNDTNKNSSSSGQSQPLLGDLLLVLGGSGGPRIISAVTNVIVNHLFLGMSLFDSIVQPRVHDQLVYNGASVVVCDNDWVKFSLNQSWHVQVGNRTRLALSQRGHGLLDVDYLGTVQAISIDPENGLKTAVCDIRKGGNPAGY